MVKLKFYYNLLSQPCRALYMFMKKTDIPFEPIPLDLRKGEHLTEEFGIINPFKKLPVIDDNGIVLIESIAILRYLCRTYNVADHWYPKDSQKQARVDEYLEWQHHNTRAHCTGYFRYKVLWPLKTDKPANIERNIVLEQRMIDNLNLLENIWLKNKPFLCGTEISVSDVVAACEIEQPKTGGFDPFISRPNLTSWIKRVQSELAPYYEEAHEIIGLTANEYKNYISKLNFKNK